MENKENERTSTKIPIPLKPLPELPKHLLKNHVVNIHRKPLKTIAQTNVLPSSSGTSSQKKIRVLDTRHVTLRRERENLDWNHAVFKNDCESDETGVSASSEEYFDGNKRITADDVLNITPSLEESPKPAKNLKKSLKRPHSRELQGVTPTHNQENREDAKRRLVFTENLKELLKSPDYWEKTYTSITNRDYTRTALEYLKVSQRKPLGTPAIPRVTRACVVNWLMKVNTTIDGNPAIIQTACWYMDSYLAVRSVRVEKLQLIASACYWIAQKLHGPNISASNITKYADYAFSKPRLLAAEQSIFRNLRFPKMPVIPHEFITYLAWLCDNEHPMKMEKAATFLCMSGLMVTNELCEELPSVIACAAVKTAVLLLGETEMLQKLMLCTLFSETENLPSFSRTCSILRSAVRAVGDPEYDYKAPLTHYGAITLHIAQQIISAVCPTGM